MGELYILLYEPAELGEPGSLERLLGDLLDAELDVHWLRVGGYGDSQVAYWNTHAEAMQSGLSAAYEHEELTFHFSEYRVLERDGFIVGTIELRWRSLSSSRSKTPARFLRLSTASTPMFSQKKYGAEGHCRRLLNIAEVLYQSCRPKFGWIESGPMKGYTTAKQIQSAEISHVYWANFFGPEYVKKFGRAYFQAAPGWRCEFLDDGGCLYVLSPDINRNKAGTKELEESVKDYFKLPAVRKISKQRKKTTRPD